MPVNTGLTLPATAALIHTYLAGSKGVHPTDLHTHPGVDDALLAELVEAGLLFVRNRGRQPYYRLTVEGQRWVVDDAMCGLLLVLHHGPARRRWLVEVVGYEIRDEDTVRRALDDGLVTVHSAGDHREVRKLTAHEFRNDRRFYVALTRKGRALLPV